MPFLRGDDPGFAAAENRFVGEQWFSWDVIPEGDPYRDTLSELERRFATARTEERWRVAADAIEQLGLDAIRPATWERHSDDAECLAAIRSLVWLEFETAYRDARRSRAKPVRDAARERLKQLTARLFPDRRGQRKNFVAHPFDVAHSYWSTLYRLRCARHFAAGVGPSGRFASATVAALSQEYGLPESDLARYLNRVERDKACARSITAEKFNIRVERVATITSTFSRKTSSK